MVCNYLFIFLLLLNLKSITPMDQKQQNRLFMMKAVRDTNKAHKNIWDKFKPYENAQDELDAKIAEIDQAAEGQQITSTGITQDKRVWSETAVEKVLSIAKNGRVYALAIKNNDLFAQLDVSKSGLLRLPDNEQAAALKAVLTATDPFVTDLADYLVTPLIMQEARDAIALSENALTRPRTTITAHSTITASVGALLNEAMLILERMDDLIHNFEKTAPAFVSNYKKARMVIDRGSRSKGDEDEDIPPTLPPII